MLVEVDQALLAAGGPRVRGAGVAAELAGHLAGDAVGGGGWIAAVEVQGAVGKARVAGRSAEGMQEGEDEPANPAPEIRSRAAVSP